MWLLLTMVVLFRLKCFLILSQDPFLESSIYFLLTISRKNWTYFIMWELVKVLAMTVQSYSEVHKIIFSILFCTVICWLYSCVCSTNKQVNFCINIIKSRVLDLSLDLFWYRTEISLSVLLSCLKMNILHVRKNIQFHENIVSCLGFSTLKLCFWWGFSVLS